MFFEEWELLTDPQLLSPLPMLYLRGVATLNDDVRQNMIADRKSRVEQEIKEHYARIEAELEATKDESVKEKGPLEKLQEMRDPAFFSV